MEWDQKNCPSILIFEAAKTTTTLTSGSSLRGKMAKCARFDENPTKTCTGGLTVIHRKTPQEKYFILHVVFYITSDEVFKNPKNSYATLGQSRFSPTRSSML